MDTWPQSLRTLVDVMLGSHQPMFVAWGAERRLLYNDGYAQLCGAKHPWAFGRPFAEVWADILGDAGPIMDRAYAGESIHMDDIMFVMRDRRGHPEETHFSFSYTPVRGERGQVVGVFCACNETTAQVITQRENVRLLARTQDTARMLQTWFEQAPGFIALLRGPNHVFELVNQAYYQLVGHREILGKPAFEALPDVRAQGFEELLNRVFETGEPFVGRALRLLVQREPGASLVETYVDLVYQPVFESDGSVSGIFAQGHDVTEQVRAVEGLRAADARKDEFLAMLAHELRNPLAPLTNAHRLIERAELLTDTGRAALAMAQRQTHHMHRLVDDLLEISRVSRGKIQLKCEPMMVATTVYHAAESVAPAIAARGQSLRVAVPEEPVQIVADPVRIAQVLENLLTNASKYTAEGGSIRVEVEHWPREVEIRVVDNGIGIEPGRIADLFELFSQLDATMERSQGGLGIGLALVKRLVELHGGSVVAASAGKGKGATFTVRLPRTSADTLGPAR